jgi:hypothetical protein
MDLRLQNLILNFSSDNLTEFFKAKVSSFKPSRENLNYILSDNNFQAFSELNKIGEIDFNGVEDLLVFACKTDRTLTERSSKKQQFEIAKKALKVDSKDGAIFVYYDSTGNFRFSFVRKNYGNKEQKFTNWKRFTYYVEKDKTNKTFKDRVGNCDFSTLDAIQKAFSVEKLTEDFYKELFAWYTWTLSEEVGITFPNNTEIVEDDRVKLEEQIIRLITRLLFVWFIKQKQLVPAGLFETEKLSRVLKDFEPNSSTEGNYYNAILQNLFFATLNKSIKERGFTETVNERDIKTLFRYDELFKDDFSKKEIIALFNEVPFLNGGLFECLDKEKSLDGVKYALDGFSRNDKKANGHFKHRAFIPNCVFFDDKKGIIPLLERYNFTVEENAPNEIQVALDPELLGNVFENLLGAFNPETKETARKQSGSFYTPREIVTYMVDESLIFYLLNAFPNLKEESIRHLFTEEELPKAFTQNHNLCEEVSQKLKEIKILDPACGSGAFPMGILNRMVTVLEKLACHKEKNVYDLKLHLIEECIYGVDIQTIAVQISKLRFFISLIVEQEEMDLAKPDENYKVITLPNLETKFVAANTLIGLASANKNLLDLNDKTLEEKKTKLWDVRKQHFYAKSAREKKNLRKDDEKLRDEIKDYISANASKPNTAFIQTLQNELTQLEKKRKNVEGELWVDETTKRTQVAMFDSVEKNPSIFKVDKNIEERKKIDTRLKAIQTEITKENNKTINVGFEKEIETIAKWNPYDQNASSPFFDVEWMFGLRNENADAGCFDVVIGNPPYVYTRDVDFGLDFKKYVSENYFNEIVLPNRSKATQSGKINLFALFILKGKKLTNIYGNLMYIIPNSILRGTTFDTIRYDLLANNHIQSIVDLGAGIFNKVTASTILLQVCHKKPSKTLTKVLTNVKSLENSEFDYKELNQTDFLQNTSFTFNIMLDNQQARISTKIKSGSLDFGVFCVDIIEGIVAHKHLVLAVPRSDTYDLIEGKDIKRFKLKDASNFLIWDRSQIHRTRPDYLWKEDKKIIMQRISGGKMPLVATLDKNRNRTFASVNNIVLKTYNNDYYEFFTCLLNSKLINWFYANNFSNNSTLTVNISKTFLETLPIKIPPEESLPMFNHLHQKLESSDADNFISLYNSLNILVYKLYDLPQQEVLIIDPEFSLSQSEYDNFKI